MDNFLTVQELNNYILGLLENDELLSNLLLKGEISGYKLYQKSGHMYLTLKDEAAAVSCVMFKSRVQNLDFIPGDGQEVLVRGRVSVFSRQGRYQVYIEEMQPFGLGEWFLYLERLKEKLAQRGYFDPSRKKSLPRVVRRLGIVTSIHGAALRDIIKVVRELNPGLEMIIAPAQVQGAGAGQEIARALQWLNEYGQVDVIIAGRGGGSIEDLMAFNSEEVAQAIFTSEIPVISAVGHETDVTLADLVADARAATPTQGAQMAVSDRSLSQAGLDRLRQRLQGGMSRKIHEQEEWLDRLMMKRIWKEALVLTGTRMKMVQDLNKNLLKAVQSLVKDQRHHFSLLQKSLQGASPGHILDRGYALLFKQEQPVSKIENISPGDALRVRLKGGSLDVVVRNVEKTVPAGPPGSDSGDAREGL